MRIRGYSSKPEGFHGQKRLGKIVIFDSMGAYLWCYGIVCVAKNTPYSIHVNSSICFRVWLGSKRSVGSKNWPIRYLGIGNVCFVDEEGRG